MRDKKCVICGKIFSPKGAAQLYCSHDCYLQAQRRRRKKHYEEQACEWCGKMFVPWLGRIYCSPECSKEAAKEYHRQYSKQYHAMKMAARPPKPPKPPKPEKIRKPRVCPICQKEFYTKDYRKTFCSPECSKENHRRWLARNYRKKKYEQMMKAMKEAPEQKTEPAYHFEEPAPKAAIRCNVARLPEPYVRSK